MEIGGFICQRLNETVIFYRFGSEFVLRKGRRYLDGSIRSRSGVLSKICDRYVATDGGQS